MSEKRASLEVIAPTAEEAIAKGLEDLGLPDEAVDVEVLDPGSKGLFGLGSRQARVRLTVKVPLPVETTQEQPAPTAASPGPPQDAKMAPPQRTTAQQRDSEMVGVKAESVSTPAVETEEGEEDPVLRVARETVSELLGKMKIRAEVTAYFGEAEDPHSRVPVMVDIRGNDLSILIGPRAETLNALQYISSLIVGKELGRSIPLVVDVEGYRVRREQQIRQLARRMADQAIKTGRRQVLEPMPANERRLVHMELRNNPDVTTQSIGEDPRRKVTIIPEK